MNKRIACLIIVVLLIISVLSSCFGSENINSADNNTNIIIENNEYYDKYMKQIDVEPTQFRVDTLGTNIFFNYIEAIDVPENRIEFTVRPTSITPIINLKKAGIDIDKIFKDYYGLYASKNNDEVDSDAQRKSIKYDDCIDEKNGRVKDGFVMMLVEYEVHNIDCDFRFFEEDKLTNYESYYNMFHLYNMVDLSDGIYMGMPIYFDEYGRDLSSTPGAIKIDKGETIKVHAGYILMAVGDDSYTDVGLEFDGSFQSNLGEKDCDYFFDISKEVKAVMMLE